MFTDRDIRFNSDFWKHIIKLWETKLIFRRFFHPQIDNQAEKGNSIIEKYLRAFATNRQYSWDSLVIIIEFTYNSHLHQPTSILPFEDNLRYISRMYLDALAGSGLCGLS
jgi:hypothetical protein